MDEVEIVPESPLTPKSPEIDPRVKDMMKTARCCFTNRDHTKKYRLLYDLKKKICKLVQEKEEYLEKKILDLENELTEKNNLLAQYEIALYLAEKNQKPTQFLTSYGISGEKENLDIIFDISSTERDPNFNINEIDDCITTIDSNPSADLFLDT
uniref:Uncharacterized protein n=1 Tax=Acrobeloides nanus TaxID=290746 RepID=A0A914D036_9BILA